MNFKVSSRARRTDPWWPARILLVLGAAACSSSHKTAAQVDPETASELYFLSPSAPAPPFYRPSASGYNLPWRKLSGRLRFSVASEFNDNINLSETDPRSDFSVGPSAGLGFVYAMSEDQTFNLDFGVGYRWYLNSPAISSLSLDPNTQIQHKWRPTKRLEFTFFDRVSVQNDPLTLPELSGEGSRLVRYQQLYNAAGLQAGWRVAKATTLTTGYDYTISRSLTEELTDTDRDEHRNTAGVFHELSPGWSLGVNASYTRVSYAEARQNDGTFFTAGPATALKLSDRASVRASFGYTLSRSEQTGEIEDSSEFGGLTFAVGLKHQFHKKLTYDANVRRSVSSGFRGNYTEMLAAQLTLDADIFPGVSLSSTFAYEVFTSSGPFGERAQRYLYSLSAGRQLTRKWSAAAGYALSLKDSNQANRGYIQNRVTVTLAHSF